MNYRVGLLVLAAFLGNFESRVGSSGLVGGSSGFSGNDLITLASIVEREAVQAEIRTATGRKGHGTDSVGGRVRPR